MLREEGFIELLQPTIGPFTDPGARGSKQVDVDFYGHRYKVMTSGIFYKQASLLAFEKIFYVAPNVRLEPPHTTGTHRHLAEFHQLDVEVRDMTRDEAMDLAERVVRHAAEAVAEMPEELAFGAHEPEGLRAAVVDGFERISHGEAVAKLHELDFPQSTDAEISWEGEVILSESYEEPFFVVGYPRGSRGFYDREDQEDPGYLRNFDLLAPEHYGELASGGEREYTYRAIVERIRETGENPEKYRWYVDMAREGLPASAGFGIGIERLTRYLAGFEDIRRSTAFPKIPGVPSP